MARERARRGLVTLAALVILLAALQQARGIVVPVLLALFLAFVSSPLVFRLHRAKVPYGVAVGLVLLLELGVLTGMGLIVGSSAARFRVRTPVYRERLVELYGELSRWLADLGVPIEAERMRELLDPGSVMDLIGATVASLGAMISSGLLVLFVLAFTLLDASRLWRKLESHFGDGDGRLLERVAGEVNRYLGVKTLTSLCTGVLVGLWCRALDVDFPVLWGLLAFLLNYIPTVGSLLAAVPPILIALLMHGPGSAALVAAGYLAVNLTLGSAIEPRILGSALGLSPVVVFLSMVLWGYVLGPIGALLSVPLTMVLKIALSNTDDWAWLADLMSGPVRGRPSVAPPAEKTAPLSSARPGDR